VKRSGRQVSCALAMAAWSCASQSSRFVPQGEQELEPKLAVVVPYPPPPAHLATMSPRPKDERCQWLDGEWRFTAKGWQWTDGAWVISPSGCLFATMHLEWQSSDEWPKGRLLWWSGRWLRDPRSRTTTNGTCPVATPCSRTSASTQPSATEPSSSTTLPPSTTSSP
jgi:hypothetical protein